MIVADINVAGANLVQEECKKLSKKPGFDALSIQVDVADADSVDAMIAKAVEVFGRIDYCVNSAGVCLLTSHFNALCITNAVY